MSEHDDHTQDDPAEAVEQPAGRPEGEDHREGAPGYDLDEQSAIRELMEERGSSEGDAAE
jgi:hypothetical protein